MVQVLYFKYTGASASSAWRRCITTELGAGRRPGGRPFLDHHHHAGAVRPVHLKLRLSAWPANTPHVVLGLPIRPGHGALVPGGEALRVADNPRRPPGMESRAAARRPAGEIRNRSVRRKPRWCSTAAWCHQPGLDPAQPRWSPARRRIPLTGEMGEFVRAAARLPLGAARRRVIAITGTNGRPPPHAHRRDGPGGHRRVVAAGNISPAALDVLMARLDAGGRAGAWVLELSPASSSKPRPPWTRCRRRAQRHRRPPRPLRGLDDYAPPRRPSSRATACRCSTVEDAPRRRMAPARPPHIPAFGVDGAGGADDFGGVAKMMARLAGAAATPASPCRNCRSPAATTPPTPGRAGLAAAAGLPRAP